MDGARIAATPAALASWPREVSIRSAGPFRALPPTMGLTATTGTPRTRARPSSSFSAGTARIGPRDTIGLDGPMTITSASLSAARTWAVGRAASMPS